MKNTSKSVKSGKGRVVSTSKRGRGRPAKYDFAGLKVGDRRGITRPLAIRNNFVTSAYLWAKRHGIKIVTEQLEKTVRVYRTA